jgi:hypothetical protein
MFSPSIPLQARRQMNLDYASALGHVAGMVATAPALPRRVEFTSVVAGPVADTARGHVLLSWSCGPRTLRLEFDADGLVDYWCDPDWGPPPVGSDGDVLASLFAWLGADRELHRSA